MRPKLGHIEKFTNNCGYYDMVPIKHILLGKTHLNTNQDVVKTLKSHTQKK